jgi:hypothetical protein
MLDSSRDTDERWNLMAALPEPVRSADGRGRPWRENRCGGQWHPVDPEDWSTMGRPAGSLSAVSNLPPAALAVGRRRRATEHPRVLAHAPQDKGYLDLQEGFIYGSFAPAKRRGARVGPDETRQVGTLGGDDVVCFSRAVSMMIDRR